MSQHEAERRAAVLLCITEPLLRAGVRASLAEVPDLELVGADVAADGRRIDVVVADAASAAEMAEERRRCTGADGLLAARILAVTGQAREHAIRTALEQGIDGFVLTGSPVGDLLAGVRALARGGHYLCGPVARQLAHIAQRDMLTSREDEVLRLLARGACNKSIARDLDIAVGTVKTHVKAIMSKLDARCRTEAACIATERGLVDLPDASSRQARQHPASAAWLTSSRQQPSFA